MWLRTIRNLLSISRSNRSERGRRPSPHRRASLRPRLEVLEERLAPATLTVLDNSDSASDAQSLRYALAHAAAGDVIDFDPSVRSISVTSVLTIGTSLSIVNDQGAGPVTLDGGGATEVFAVNGGVTATLSGLTIAHGYASGNGGGIWNDGALTVVNCTFANNTAISSGGAIVNYATLTLTNCTFTGNYTQSSGGAVFNPNDNPGGYSFTTLTAANCTFADNFALGNGGAIDNDFSSTLSLSNCTFTANTAGQAGGAIENRGVMTVRDSTVSGNQAGPSDGGSGGGIDNHGPALLTGDIVAGNTRGGTAVSSYLRLVADIRAVDHYIGGPLVTDSSQAQAQGAATNPLAASVDAFAAFGGTSADYRVTATATWNGPTAGHVVISGGLASDVPQGPQEGAAVEVDSDGPYALYGQFNYHFIPAASGLFTLQYTPSATTTFTYPPWSVFAGQPEYFPPQFDVISNTLGELYLSGDSGGTYTGYVVAGHEYYVALANGFNTGTYQSGSAEWTAAFDFTIPSAAPIPDDISLAGGGSVGPSLDPASQGSLIGVGGSGGLVDGQNGNQVGVPLADVGLDPLGDYGGPTQTMALLPGSLAIGRGVTETTAAADQRGVARPVGSLGDVGAFQSRGFTLSVGSGDSQSAVVDTAFGQPLTVQVAANDPNVPLDGAVVTFTPPPSGASAVLSTTTATVSGGLAWVTAVANDTLGDSYPVTASLPGVAPVTFHLTNRSKASPVLTGTASATPVAGQGWDVAVSAALSGSDVAGGAIEFDLVGSAGTVVSKTVAVSGDDTYNADAVVSSPGAYTWQTHYSGDPLNNPADASAPVTVSQASPMLFTSTVATPIAGRGWDLGIGAYLLGSEEGRGSIEFDLVGPAGVVSKTVAVSGDGDYIPYPDVVVSSPGDYTWQVHYSGDPLNNPADASAPVTVSQASPMLFTSTVTTPITGGGWDLGIGAYLLGSEEGRGAIEFDLVGPAGVVSKTVPVSGDGDYIPYPDVVVSSAGGYTWQVHYSGDPLNNPADASAPVTVSQASPTLTATASATPVAGQGWDLGASATLSGSLAAGGSIEFDLVGSGGTVASKTVAVSGDGTYTADAMVSSPGSYTWQLHYSGDVLNNPADGSAPVTASQAPTLSAVTGVMPVVGQGWDVSVSAALSGGLAPTGAIGLFLDGPNDFIAYPVPLVSVSGDGVYTFDAVVPYAGTYDWSVYYFGDPLNQPAINSGSVTASKASPALTADTAATPVAGQGWLVEADADLSGGFAPGGAVEFDLVGPAGSVVSQTVVAAGDGFQEEGDLYYFAYAVVSSPGGCDLCPAPEIRVFRSSSAKTVCESWRS